MKIYLDACCLNRPFDDLSQERVFLESEAILHIISRCDNGELTLFSGDVIDFELSKMPDEERRGKILELLSSANNNYITLSDTAVSMAKQFQTAGVRRFDSYHLAAAEQGSVDVLFTTDDQFIKSAARTNVKLKVINPLKWLMEVLNDE